MPKHQLSLTLINHQVAESIIQQRAEDGYINATQLCAAAGKRWHNYLRNETTGNFIRALASKTRISVPLLYQQVTAESGTHSTWVHPKIAIHLAQWLSADFAVQVSEWVYDWMSGVNRVPTALPYHLRRHMLNIGKIPSHSHFSILQELTNTLIAPLEANGYTLPDHMMPDISQGKMFCKFARETLKLDTDALPTYEHEFEGRPSVQAKLYPLEYLGAFRNYIGTKWMPERAAGYFQERDPGALPALDAVLRLTYTEPRANAANKPTLVRRKRSA